MEGIEQVLKKYSLSRETAQKYIDGITRLNQTQTAEEIGVSRDTINRYKKAFQKMTPLERSLLISTLTQDNILQQVED
jgi:DNA-binding XRE family transcriptional regulator